VVIKSGKKINGTKKRKQKEFALLVGRRNGKISVIGFNSYAGRKKTMKRKIYWTIVCSVMCLPFHLFGV